LLSAPRLLIVTIPRARTGIARPGDAVISDEEESMRSSATTFALICWLISLPADAQEPAPVPAATVNGQPITELAVQRGLKRIPPEKQAAARGEIVQFLVDNLVVDQYLAQLYPDAPQQEIEKRVEQVRADIKKEGQSFEKVLQELSLTEDELRTQVASEMRWEKYTGEQATEKVLRDYFQANAEMFDGTLVRARHILIEVATGDPNTAEAARQRLLAIKAAIETEVQKAQGNLPAAADNLAREKTRIQAMESAFADAARKESSCPSKEQGGDLNWFPRSGSKVEPFAAAAFALKPHEMSGVVATQFGLHLILLTDRRPGKETSFESVKDVVKEVYSDRLRQSLCSQLKPRATIVINKN
jgi:peptidyl-prolyl cis-trans isomerase C